MAVRDPTAPLGEENEPGWSALRHRANLDLLLRNRDRRDKPCIEFLEFQLNLSKTLLLTSPENRTLWNVRREILVELSRLNAP